MSKYLKAFVTYMGNVQKSIAQEHNPHRKAILENYLAHAACEFSGNDVHIFDPSRTVAEPIYNVKLGDTRVTYRGMKDVQAYYDRTNEEIVMLNDEVLMVSDWGLSSYSTFVRFVKGETLAAEAWDGENTPGKVYLQISPLAMFWPYDSDAKMIGEDVWVLDKPTVSVPAPEDIVTLAARNAAAKPFLPVLNEVEYS
ncbi:MAG: hypothetical protein JWO15_2246 [Sphingomonadales bacterium]|nr:hypothetical protein [Sphingomonadales bacterium]